MKGYATPSGSFGEPCIRGAGRVTTTSYALRVILDSFSRDVRWILASVRNRTYRLNA